MYKKFSIFLKFGILTINDFYYKRNVSKEEILIHPGYNDCYPYIDDIVVIQFEKVLKFEAKFGKMDMVDRG